jgi:HSP20 family protein
VSDRLVRGDPFRDLVSIQDDLSRLFGRSDTGAEPMRRTTSGSWMPSMDVFETEDRIVAKLELPGIEPDAVEVSVEDSTLTISGSFTRSITLPQTVDTEKVEAAFDRGILTVEVPKVERRSRRRSR